jgi:hypothetical protein
MRDVIYNIGLDKTGNIWDSIVASVAHNNRLLKSTSVVVVYKERDGSKGINCREIALHDPPHRAYGVEFSSCITPGCNPLPYTMIVDEHQAENGRPYQVSIRCLDCGRQSARVSFNDVQQHITRVHSRYPNVYWHPYLTTPALAALFLTWSQ